jgi:hypothetical protein
MSRWQSDSLLFCVCVTVKEVAGGTAGRLERKESVELKPRPRVPQPNGLALNLSILKTNSGTYDHDDFGDWTGPSSLHLFKSTWWLSGRHRHFLRLARRAMV